MKINISKIPLIHIESIIPRKLYLKFQYYKISNIGDVIKLDFDEFSQHKGVGKNLLRLLDDFKYLIDKNPQFIIQAYEKSIESSNISKLPQINKIEIKYIKSIIPNKLYKKLERYGIDNIESFTKLDKEDFKKFHSVGDVTLKLFDDFKNLIIKKPDYVYSTYQKNNELKISLKDDEFVNKDFLTIFIETVDAYFLAINKPDQKDILLKRYGVGEKKSYTLEEIAMFYNLTKERIRQIQSHHIYTLKLLMNGGFIKKVKTRVNAGLIKAINNFNLMLSKHKILTKHQMYSLLEDKFSVIIFPNELPYLKMLFDIFKIEEAYFRENVFYFLDEEVNRDKFQIICAKVFKVLETKVIPVTKFELIVNVKKLLDQKKIDNQLIELALKTISEVEQVSDRGEKKYQIKFDYLSSVSDYVYRILFEKKSKMSYQEILREINHRLTLAGIENRITAENILAQLRNNKNILPIGKSGYWVLADWEQDTKTLKNLIIEVLNFFNRPCTFKEIFDKVHLKRPEIKKETIYTYINLYENDFAKLKNKKIILKLWEKEYIDSIDKEEKYFGERVSEETLNNAIVNIFSKISVGKLTTKQIIEHLRNQNIKLAASSFAARFDRNLILKKEKIGKRCYFSLVENYDKIMSRIRYKTTQEPKFELIKQKILELFKSEKTNELFLSYIIKVLKNKHSFSKGSLYSIFQTDDDFIKRKNKDGKILISLSKQIRQQILNSQDDEKDQVIKLIKLGENDSIEFKSSLRWDYKTKNVNKEIEFEVAKAISAFLNTEGGRLFIGIDDLGNLLGLNNDYKVVPKKNKDGFQLQLIQIINNYLGKDVHNFISFKFFTIEDIEIGCVNINKSDNPNFLRKDNTDMFFIRASSSSQSLSISEAVKYIKSHWGK